MLQCVLKKAPSCVVPAYTTAVFNPPKIPGRPTAEQCVFANTTAVKLPETLDCQKKLPATHNGDFGLWRTHPANCKKHNVNLPAEGMDYQAYYCKCLDCYSPTNCNFEALTAEKLHQYLRNESVQKMCKTVH